MLTPSPAHCSPSLCSPSLMLPPVEPALVQAVHGEVLEGGFNLFGSGSKPAPKPVAATRRFMKPGMTRWSKPSPKRAQARPHQVDEVRRGFSRCGGGISSPRRLRAGSREEGRVALRVLARRGRPAVAGAAAAAGAATTARRRCAGHRDRRSSGARRSRSSRRA